MYRKYYLYLYNFFFFLNNILFNHKFHVYILNSSGGIPARNARGERLLLFLGVIDILQSYRLKKKLEHTWKSMIHDGVSDRYIPVYVDFLLCNLILLVFLSISTFPLLTQEEYFSFSLSGYSIGPSARILRATLSRFHGQDSIQENTIT